LCHLLNDQQGIAQAVGPKEDPTEEYQMKGNDNLQPVGQESISWSA
jgi:hypothetical protein